MTNKSRKSSLSAAITLTAAISHGANVIAFSPPSASYLPSRCRNFPNTLTQQHPLGGYLPRQRTIHDSNFIHTKLHLFTNKNEEKAKNSKNNILEPGNFPTIIIEEPQQEDIYKQAILRTLLWVGLASAFGTGLGILVSPEISEEFFAGYLVEQSLSVDNLFVFLLLFEYFRVPLKNQDRVLNWGIYGAVVMRAVMIGLGAAALENFHAILLVFAGILVYSSVKTLMPGDEEEDDDDLSENSIVKFSRNLIDSTDKFDGDRFFTIVDGVKKATPLFICMIALEISDIVFAVDSVPAVFGVTSSPLVVFSSNMFAIMGLRSLYTILSKAATDLKYLEPAVGVVLGFIGTKMIGEYFGAEIPTEVALGVVATFLSGGVALSVIEKNREEEQGES
mmetsp:Transcript_28437/g.56777  ORF Transcript_28437/g.56777 Transcript_28437/m.56777 type:complete len:392 (-) Transcript_28437:123-1298(-)